MIQKKYFSIFYIILPAWFVLFSALSLNALSGEEILRKMDANLKYDSISYTATMEIYLGEANPRTKTMRATAVSDQKAYVEFVNKEDSKTKYLKLNKQMWI